MHYLFPLDCLPQSIELASLRLDSELCELLVYELSSPFISYSFLYFADRVVDFQWILHQ